MKYYFFKRFLLIVPTLFGITIITFIITRFVPGGPIEKYIYEAGILNAENSGGSVVTVSSPNTRQGLNEEDLSYLKKFYGFDKPWWRAYMEWVGKIAVFDLGMSHRYSEPVIDLIIERLPISLYYGITTTLMIYLVCIPLGIYKALNHGKYADFLTSLIIYVGYAVPGFVLGIILQSYIAGTLGWLPLGGFTGTEFDSLGVVDKIKDIIYHSILPLFAYMIGGFAVLTVLMKNSLLEHMSADYVKTAYAKGLNKPAVVIVHVLKNSLLPVVATIGGNIALILTGSFLIETIFNINGLGLLGYVSLTERDYPVVLGTLYISAWLFLLGNIISDICVSFLDPRIQFK